MKIKLPIVKQPKVNVFKKPKLANSGLPKMPRVFGKKR